MRLLFFIREELVVLVSASILNGWQRLLLFGQVQLAAKVDPGLETLALAQAHRPAINVESFGCEGAGMRHAAVVGEPLETGSVPLATQRRG